MSHWLKWQRNLGDGGGVVALLPDGAVITVTTHIHQLLLLAGDSYPIEHLLFYITFGTSAARVLTELRGYCTKEAAMKVAENMADQLYPLHALAHLKEGCRSEPRH